MLIESDDDDNESTNSQMYTALEAVAGTSVAGEDMEYEDSADSAVPFSQEVCRFSTIILN